jgi:hypothetical protein
VQGRASQAEGTKTASAGGAGHKSTKRRIELRGYRIDIGLDGYPTDPNHPFNRAR